MENAMLYSKIEMLPDNLKNEVEDFVGYLLQKISKPKRDNEKPKELKERQFGAFKGLIKMSADFDEPLDEFKDYM
jgi:hypothetical protein